MPTVFAAYAADYDIGPQGKGDLGAWRTPQTFSGTPNADTLAASAEGIIDGMLSNVNSFAKQQAESAAAAGVLSI